MIEQTMPNGMRRRVEFSAAFDKRNPNPSKNYGIHGMEIRFVLIGPCGAVQFVVYTGMHLPHVRDEQFARWQREGVGEYDIGAPMGADIGYHALTPQWEGQQPMDACGYLGQPCYYDGSSLQAEEFMPSFLGGGDDAVWTMLESRYADVFDDAARERREEGN